MNDDKMMLRSPLFDINYSFVDYLNEKKGRFSALMDGNGLPSYAYKMDYVHRKTLDSIPGLYAFAKKLISIYVPQFFHEYSLQGIAVGPDQYPEIYKMGRECAEVLGIGIPNILVVPTMGGDEFNACTLAADDVEPIIVITGEMVERMKPLELKAIIGHECGHIHNQHTVYGVLENIIQMIGLFEISSIPALSIFTDIFTQAAQLALNMWSRAAEVSADRAALVCTGDVEITRSALAKLMYRGANMSQTITTDINYDALRNQLNEIINNPHKVAELSHSHPIAIKRVFSVMDFGECETFYQWRPDVKVPDITLLSKEETDKKCKAYIDVLMSKGA